MTYVFSRIETDAERLSKGFGSPNNFSKVLL